MLSEQKTGPQPACLIVECSDLKKLPSLQNNTLIRVSPAFTTEMLHFRMG